MGAIAVEPDGARTSINADIAGDPPPSIRNQPVLISRARRADGFSGNTGTNEWWHDRVRSPEQGAWPHVDPRTDIFSFGCALRDDRGADAVHGKNRFRDSDRDPAKAGDSAVHLLPPHRVKLERIVERALRKERYDRYQTIRELARDLKHSGRAEFRAKLADSDPENRAAYKVSDRQGAFSPTDSTDSTEPHLPPASDATISVPIRSQSGTDSQAESDGAVRLWRRSLVADAVRSESVEFCGEKAPCRSETL